MCVALQMETDSSSAVGKARIIHKESDIITAFAINKVRWLLSCLPTSPTLILKPTHSILNAPTYTLNAKT